MKSSIIASTLFGALALAAPVDRRDLYTKTELVVETIVVFTTVYDGEAPVAEATTSAGLFYESPSAPAASEAKATSTSAYVPPVVESSSSVYVAPTSTKAAEPEPETTTPAYTPPAETTQAAVTSAYTPSPVSSAPAATSSASTGTGSGSPSGSYEGVDITVYDAGLGACGDVSASEMAVALSAGLMGEATYDFQTGAPTNPYCDKPISITYNGNTIQATIKDRCAGCLHANDLDLTKGAWKALTGTDEITRFTGASWTIG